jgi:FecR protein
MNIQRRLVSFVALILAFGPAFSMAEEGTKEGIGFYTAVLGKATVTHLGEAQVLPVKLQDEVLFKDVIQTEHDSRTRALFQDDSMLTVGENSRVEIDEYIYNPEKNVRLAIVKLMQGQVRALVSKVFKANGSKFEIHTPSAVAAARGTYFTVWVENGQSGIINIGEKGRVDFTSGGTTVAVDPGFFSVAKEGQAPSVPLLHQLGLKGHDLSTAPVKSAEKTATKPVMIDNQGQNVLPQREKADLIIQASPLSGLTRALAAVELTTLREAPLVELPIQVLQALNLDARLLKALTSLASLSGGSLSEGGGKTTAVATGTSTTGTLTVGPVSVATTSTSAGTVSLGSVTVGAAAPLAPATSAVVAPLTPVVSTVVAPVTTLVSTVVAPVTPVVTTILAPVAPVITTVLAPVTPLITTVVAPVVPVIAPVVAPVTPIINAVLATPPAVISGALGLLSGN